MQDKKGNNMSKWKDISNISMTTREKRKTAGGYKWKIVAGKNI